MGIAGRVGNEDVGSTGLGGEAFMEGPPDSGESGPCSRGIEDEILLLADICEQVMNAWEPIEAHVGIEVTWAEANFLEEVELGEGFAVEFVEGYPTPVEGKGVVCEGAIIFDERGNDSWGRYWSPGEGGPL